MAMAELSYAENIIKCKADQNSPVWNDLFGQLTHQVHPKKITRCGPITQIEKAQKEVKRDNDLVKDLFRISNAYYCLLRYAVNLSGDSDKTIYKVIKMYTGYYVYNISSVIADEALSILKDMGYYLNDEYQDELELSTDEEGGIYRPEASQLKRIIFDLFLSHLLCQKIAKNIDEAFRELEKYNQAGKELKSEIACEIIWEIKEGQFVNVEKCMNKLENSKHMKQRRELEQQKEMYRQKQREKQEHEQFKKPQFEKQKFEQQQQQHQFGQRQAIQKIHEAHMQQQQQQADHNVDDSINDEDLYGCSDNHDQYSMRVSENPKLTPTPKPRTDRPSRPTPSIYENATPSIYENADNHHPKIPIPSLYESENIAEDEAV